MTTPLPQLLAQVSTLNDPTQPFTFEVKGNEIVGKWDIVRAKTLYPKEFKTIDKKYSITVTLAPAGPKVMSDAATGAAVEGLVAAAPVKG